MLGSNLEACPKSCFGQACTSLRVVARFESQHREIMGLCVGSRYGIEETQAGTSDQRSSLSTL